jgi:aspartate 1-decarboxylase
VLVTLLKSKLHRAVVTVASVEYEGSLGIDQELAEAVGFLPYERILVSNMANGNRFETYVIIAPRGERGIELRGAAALLGAPGDRLTIMSFAQVSDGDAAAHLPRVALLGDKNEILRLTP